MISIGLGTVVAGNGSSFGGFSAEYQAVLTAGSGFTQPNSSEQTLQNQLIVDLKNAGIWTKLDAFYMFANNITDSTGAFARINWKSPSANYVESLAASPTITAKNGFFGDGSNQGLNLKFNASAGINFKDPNASYGVYLGSIGFGTSFPIMGANGSTNAYNRIRQNGTNAIAGSTTNAIIFKTNDFIHLNRKFNVSAIANIYVNGSSAASTFPNNTFANDTFNFNVLRYGDLASYGTGQIRTVFIGGDLSTEASSFRSILKDYFNTLFATTNFLVNPTNITLSPWGAADFTPALTHYNSGGITNLPYDNLRATSPNLGFYYQNIFTSPAVPNGTFSVYLKGTGSVRLGIFNNGSATTTTVTLTTNWRQYSVTRTNIISGYLNVAIYIDDTSDIDICYPNFEATTIANPLS